MKELDLNLIYACRYIITVCQDSMEGGGGMGQKNLSPSVTSKV